MSNDALIQRTENVYQRLQEDDVSASPLETFREWFQAAQDHEHVLEPHAMTLATATPDGRPSARMVLLRSFDERGFCFYTNYKSRKGQELAENPQAALLLWWGVLQRQIRIEGGIEKLTAAESDAYYNSRPRESRLGAWASAQSQVIAGRHVLEAQLAELHAKYADVDPPRPPYWGGFRLVPAAIEFWQGGPHRLHDRLQYTRQDNGDWQIVRLSP